MIDDELIPNIDPKKLFNEQEYKTIIVGSEGFVKKDALSADCITILLNHKSTREEKDEALLKLKENNAQEFIINFVKQTKNLKQKALAISVCWETGLDFSKYYLLFVELICHDDFSVSLEAYTVINEMEAEIDSSSLKKGLEILKQATSKTPLVLETIQFIEQKLNS